VEFEELVRLMRAFVQLSAERGKPLKRFLAEYTDGSVCDVSADLLRTIATTGPGRPSASVPVDRGPQTIPEAIRLALLLVDSRQTVGQLTDDIQRRWGDRGWLNESVGIEAARMVRAGGLVNHRRDPGDGRGAGYGLVEWEPPEET
jgi:hypothetical protein